jgi:hypothetical protein
VSPGVAWFREHVYAKSAQQIFAPPPKYEGHIYSPHKDERWAADIIVRPSGVEGWRYALIVQDIFSRFAYGEVIASPMQAYEGMRAILRRARPPPQILITDEDPGFKAPRFQEVLQDRRIIHEFREGRNDIATVDRLIGTIKRIMAGHEAEGEDRSLEEIIDGINASPTEVLYGSAPEDVTRDNKALIFQRTWDEAHNMLDNSRRIAIRVQKLRQAGAYRTLEGKGFRRRAGQAIWSRAVRPVKELDGAFVDGRPTKEVLPTTGEAAAPAELPKKVKARSILLRYATGLVDAFDDDDVLPSQRVYRELVKIAGTRQNLLNALREAGLSAVNPVNSFVRAFPDFYKLEGAKVRIVDDD